uniref:Uncharacterized protein n=1 Tax=Meloidogyne enterolobii TaxID=390850 RepID=A0A6V7UGI6_MELEN|nr:unnamed protein product [Meloidogyne enterolobii]
MMLDGSTVSVQKTTTTTTELTTTTPTVVINREHYNDINNDQQNEVDEQENKNTKNKENNSNGILDNQQMDVSMTRICLHLGQQCFIKIIQSFYEIRKIQSKLDPQN